MPIKTFRGKIADGGIDTIVLHTNTGSTGYRIVKLQGLPKDANSDLEAVLKIYKVDQTAADTDIDFSDQTLLGAMIKSAKSNVTPPLLPLPVHVCNLNASITATATIRNLNKSCSHEWSS